MGDWLNDWLNDGEDEERRMWCTAAALILARAYAEDEPAYSLELIKERNPEFQLAGSAGTSFHV